MEINGMVYYTKPKKETFTKELVNNIMPDGIGIITFRDNSNDIDINDATEIYNIDDKSLYKYTYKSNEVYGIGNATKLNNEYAYSENKSAAQISVELDAANLYVDGISKIVCFCGGYLDYIGQYGYFTIQNENNEYCFIVIDIVEKDLSISDVECIHFCTCKKSINDIFNKPYNVSINDFIDIDSISKENFRYDASGNYYYVTLGIANHAYLSFIGGEYYFYPILMY